MDIRYTSKAGKTVVTTELKDFQQDFLRGNIDGSQTIEANGQKVTAAAFAAMTATLETPTEQKNQIQEFIDHDLILKMEDSSRKALGNALIEFKGRKTKEKRTVKNQVVSSTGCALIIIAIVTTGLLSLWDISIGVFTGAIGFLLWYYVWDKEHKPKY